VLPDGLAQGRWFLMPGGMTEQGWKLAGKAMAYRMKPTNRARHGGRSESVAVGAPPAGELVLRLAAALCPGRLMPEIISAVPNKPPRYQVIRRRHIQAQNESVEAFGLLEGGAFL